jgi:hypothetical protein
MIVTQLKPEGICPIILCDQCGRQIENPVGIVYTNFNKWVDGKILQTYFVHKSCHREFEASGKLISSDGWMELSDWMNYLLDNTGFNDEEDCVWEVEGNRFLEALTRIDQEEVRGV